MSDEYQGQFDGPQGGEDLGLDEFLNYSDKAEFGGTTLKWRDDGRVIVYLHPKVRYLPLWGHRWTRLAQYKDKDGAEVKAFRNRRWLCMEDPKTVLKKRYMRDKETRARRAPPVICPHCLFQEWLYQEVHTGSIFEAKRLEIPKAKLDAYYDSQVKSCLAEGTTEFKSLGFDKILDSGKRNKLAGEYAKNQTRRFERALAEAEAYTTTVFRFHDDGVDEDDIEITAGGMLSLFGDRKMTEEKKFAARRAKLRLDEVFKQNQTVRCQYVFGVVNANKPEDGALLAFEAESIGNGMKTELKKVIKVNSSNPDLADPWKHPYPFEWTYNEEEENPQKKYEVTALTKEEPSEEVLAVFAEDGPDMASLRKLEDPEALRAEMETYCVLEVEVPWDDIFARAIAAWKRNAPAEKPKVRSSEKTKAAEELEDGEMDENDIPEEKPKKAAKTEPKKVPPKATEPASETYVCHVCAHEQTSDGDCEACGATYGEDGMVPGGEYDKNDPPVLIGRACTKCGTTISLADMTADDKGVKVGICGKCATMHEHPKWTVRLPPTKTEEKPAKRGRRAATA